MDTWKFKPTLLHGDALEQLKTLDDCSVDCCVTSPPYYGLRNYLVDGQIGLEETPDEYIAKLVDVFREVRRLLKDDGTLWVNIADSYYNYRPGGTSQSKQTLSNNTGGVVDSTPKRNRKFDGIKEKDLIGIPWMLGFALRADLWYLRQEIIWEKGSCMPESVTDRCTKSHESIFLLAKSKSYYFDARAIAEPTVTRDNSDRDRDASKLNNCPGRTRMGGLKTNDYETRNKRDVWHINPQPFSGAHFATFPVALPETCILAGSRVGGTVLDPFNGAGTTGVAAMNNGRNYIGIDLNADYLEITRKRFSDEVKYSEPLFEV